MWDQTKHCDGRATSSRSPDLKTPPPSSKKKEGFMPGTRHLVQAKHQASFIPQTLSISDTPIKQPNLPTY